MSVLTVARTVPPERSFAISGGADLRNQPSPQLPVELPSYTRASSYRSQPAAANSHRHSRSISSSNLPSSQLTAPKPNLVQRHSYNHLTQPSSLSSQPSSKTHASMQRHGTTGSASSGNVPRRSTSGRSVATNSPTSYVALMRKQKATVWCDRAQSIDARMAAQQKAAKQRAVLEVVGNNSQRTSTITTTNVVGKRAAKASHYTPPNPIGTEVPRRLLAFDMQGEEEQEGRVMGDNTMVHARTGSGKSSIKSGKYRSGYPRAHASPPEGGSPAREGIPEAGETPGQPEQHKDDYFDQPHTKTSGSDSEDSFGELTEMRGPNSQQHAMDQKALEELRRRGSVDDRQKPVPQRLFVVNPDSD